MHATKFAFPVLLVFLELLAMRNAQSQFLNVQAGWGKQHSLDTEDEENDFKRLSLERLQANSEERVLKYQYSEKNNYSENNLLCLILIIFIDCCYNAA